MKTSAEDEAGTQPDFDVHAALWQMDLHDVGSDSGRFLLPPFFDVLRSKTERFGEVPDLTPRPVWERFGEGPQRVARSQPFVASAK